MKNLIYNTNNSYAPFILRVLFAIVLLPHGAQKLFGLFGGFGFTGTMGFFTHTMGLPWIIGFLVIMLEFFGAIALLVGYVTRPVSIALTILMLGIVFSSHLQNGFWMNWFGRQKGEGYEYFILYVAGTLSLLISGGGKWSVDSTLSK
ncbi:DoxX family protein [Mucilaginibacter terrigena]|uniref:DoxX family protein n=1 Tax=Mucilaginibacter terrigena TaxID=2492395 RepID=A0A4Q5LQX7_9SPHI|nr:DoxX family protein [Mucilaginibacter terrigena]RYU91918.1 DoxX family protein [Mucilaginibacter terrigena]